MSDDNVTWAAGLWERHQADLRALVSRLVANRFDVDDIVAATYEVLTRVRDRGRVVTDERLLVLGVGANVARHHLRSQRRIQRLEEAVAAETPSQLVTRPDEHFERQQIEADLAWAIDQLPPEQRSLIVKLNEGASAASLSRALGEPEATVRSRAFHARKGLKVLLSQRWLIVLALGLLMATAYAAYAIAISQRSPEPAPKPVPVMPRPLGQVLPRAEPNEDTATPSPTPSAPSPRPKTVAGPSPPVSPAQEPVKRETQTAPAQPPTALELFEEANRAQFVEKNYPQAISGWSHFLLAYPDSALADDARHNRVVALFKLGRLAEAEERAREALRLAPSTPHRRELEGVIQLIEDSKRP